MMTREGLRHGEGQRGSVAILTAILIVVLVGMAAFVVDVGLMHRVRNELQNSADAAAMAGASRLNGTDAGIAAARQAVQDWANQHLANNSMVSIVADDILFGHWDLTNRVFTVGPILNPTDAGPINAVQVTSRRTAATSNSVGLFFAPILGKPQTDIIADAVAVGGGPANEECGFPMVVSDCVMADQDPSHYCDYCMQFLSAVTDNAGWTSFENQQQANDGMLTNLIAQACCVSGQDNKDGGCEGEVAVDQTTGKCTGSCSAHTNDSSYDDGVKVQNGNNMPASAKSFCELIKDILRRGAPVPDGCNDAACLPQAFPFEVRVPVIASSPRVCPETDFSGRNNTISGFATMVIYGASCGGGQKTPPAAAADSPTCEDYKNPGAWPPSSDKYIIAQLKCGVQDDAPGGGINAGVHAVHPLLVK